MKTTTCPRCGKRFDVKEYRLRDGARPTCSRRCGYGTVQVVCETCGKCFDRAPSHLRCERVFCSRKCAASTRFARGHATWNRDLNGIHLSPKSEFKPGRISTNQVPIGTVRIRKSWKRGFERAYVKVAEPNRWILRAWKVWRDHRGPFKRGMVIHHRDRDTLNDAIENLACLTKAEHLKEHQPEHLASKQARRLARVR